MRGLKTTIGLLVVLGGLGAYIYFVTWKQPAEDTTASKVEKVFAGLQSDKVDEIRVNAESGDSTLLKKDPGGWHLVEPVQSAAQDSDANGIASALSQIEIARVIDENPTPTGLVEYGLGAPRLEIDFKGPGDKGYKKLLIGGKSPTGANIFAKRNDEKRVFQIAAFQEATFNRSTFDLRDKTAMRFDREKVDHVEVTADNKTVELAKTGNDWKIVKPLQAPADITAADGLIGKVQTAQMKSIVSDNVVAADLKKYGLDKPTASITLSLGSAKASLLLGGKAGDGSLYAKDASTARVMTLDPTLIDDFKKGAGDYRKKDLFAFRAYDATHIELTRGKDTIAFDKIKGAKAEDEDKWRRSGAKADADKEKMGVFLAKLESLRAMSFVDTTAKTGLDAPALTVYAKFEDGKKEERVTFGKSGSDAYASRPGEPGAAKINPTEFDEIIKKLDELAK